MLAKRGEGYDLITFRTKSPEEIADALWDYRDEMKYYRDAIIGFIERTISNLEEKKEDITIISTILTELTGLTIKEKELTKESLAEVILSLRNYFSEILYQKLPDKNATKEEHEEYLSLLKELSKKLSDISLKEVKDFCDEKNKTMEALKNQIKTIQFYIELDKLENMTEEEKEAFIERNSRTQPKLSFGHLKREKEAFFDSVSKYLEISLARPISGKAKGEKEEPETSLDLRDFRKKIESEAFLAIEDFIKKEVSTISVLEREEVARDMQERKVKVINSALNLLGVREEVTLKNYSRAPALVKENQFNKPKILRDLTICEEILFLERGEKLQAEIDIPVDLAKALARQGVYQAADLAVVNLKNLPGDESAKPAMRRAKSRAIFCIATLAPASVLEIFEKNEITDLSTLASYQSTKLKRLIASNDDIKKKNISREKLTTLVGSYDKYNIPNHKNIRIYLNNYFRAVSEEEAVREYSYLLTKLADAAEIFAEKFREYIPRICDNCEWENSITSEKGYLAYLKEIARRYGRYTGIEILDRPDYYSYHGQELTQVQYDIAIFQKNLRQKDITFLSFEAWQAKTSQRFYPENEFERLFSYLTFDYFFNPALLDEEASDEEGVAPSEEEVAPSEEEVDPNDRKIEIVYENIKEHLLSIDIHPYILISDEERRHYDNPSEAGVVAPEDRKLKALYTGDNVSTTVSVIVQTQLASPHERDLKLRDKFFHEKFLRGSEDEDSVLKHAANIVKNLFYTYKNMLEVLQKGFNTRLWLSVKTEDGQGYLNLLETVFKNLYENNTNVFGVPEFSEADKIFNPNLPMRYDEYKQIMGLVTFQGYVDNIKEIVKNLLLKQNYELKLPESPTLNAVFSCIADELKNFFELSGQNTSVNDSFMIKEFITVFPSKIYSLLNSYDHYYVASVRTDDLSLPEREREPFRYVSVSNYLNTKSKIQERLQLTAKTVSLDYWDNLMQLLFNLLYYFPYLKLFLFPIVNAKYEQSNNNFEDALRWLSLIYDHAADNPTFILPFTLNTTEQNYVRILICEVLLDYAETLYRGNNYRGIQYARELYHRIFQIFKDYECYVSEPGTEENTASLLLNIHNTMYSQSDTLALKKVYSKFYETFAKTPLYLQPHRQKLITLNNVPTANFKEKLETYVNSFERRQRVLVSSSSTLSERDVEEGNDSLTYSLPMNNIPNPGSSSNPLLDEVFIGPEGGIVLINYAALMSRHQLCLYPNPRVLSMLNMAYQNATYIVHGYNFLGYQNDYLSIYNYDALLAKARYYLQLAIQLKKEWLTFLDKYESEELLELNTIKSLRIAHAQKEVANLETRAAHQSLILSDLNVGRAQAAKDIHTETLDIKNSFGGWMAATGPAIMAGILGASTSVGGIMGVAKAGAAILNHKLDIDILELQGALYGQDIAVAQQNFKIAETQLAVAHARKEIANIAAFFDSKILHILQNQILDKEAYFYLFNRTKQLYKTYLDMAIRFAWLFQRQLEFLRAGKINAIRFNYFHETSINKERNLFLAAERLQEDIEKLHFHKNLSDKSPIRVKKTFSLLNEYPVSFIEFKRNGRITFRTTADYLKLKDEGGRLKYDGHAFKPDYLGHIQQRIMSIDLRIIGLIGRDQDVKLTLWNRGHSIVMAESNYPADEELITPAVLRHPYTPVVFNRTSDQSTENTYAFTAKDGLLKPFEGVGLDTAWELTLDPAVNKFNLTNIYDIQLIIDYTAQYNPHYKEQQLEEDRIPSSFSRTRLYSFKIDFPDAYYQLQNNPPYLAPAMRDIRYLSFETNEQQVRINESEKNHKITRLSLYAHSSKTQLAVLNYQLGFWDDSKEDPKRRQEKSILNRPEDRSELNGIIDTSDKDPSPLEKLVHHSSNLHRFWSIKLTPKDNDLYRRKNFSGEPLDTSDEVLSKKPDYLLCKNDDDRNDKVLLVDGLPDHLDNCWCQFKFDIHQGKTFLYWKVMDQFCELQLTTIGDDKARLIIPRELGGNILYEFDTDNWCLLEMIAHKKNDDGTIYLKIRLDKVVIFDSDIKQPHVESLDTSFAFKIEKKTAETVTASETITKIKVDDIVIQRANNSGSADQVIYAETFSTGARNIITVDPNTYKVTSSDSAAPNNFFVITEDKNPALDFTDIDDMLMVMDYSYNPTI